MYRGIWYCRRTTKMRDLRCVPRILELIKTISKASIPIDRPGMKKFFSHGKGPKFVESIEDVNSCIIIPRERNENESLLITDEKEMTEFQGSPPEFICSFLVRGKRRFLSLETTSRNNPLML